MLQSGPCRPHNAAAACHLQSGPCRPHSASGESEKCEMKAKAKTCDISPSMGSRCNISHAMGSRHDLAPCILNRGSEPVFVRRGQVRDCARRGSGSKRRHRQATLAKRATESRTNRVKSSGPVVDGTIYMSMKTRRTHTDRQKLKTCDVRIEKPLNVNWKLKSVLSESQ